MVFLFLSVYSHVHRQAVLLCASLLGSCRCDKSCRVSVGMGGGASKLWSRCCSLICAFFFFFPAVCLFFVLCSDPMSCGLNPSYLLQLLCFACLPSSVKKKLPPFLLFLRGLRAFPFVFVPSFDLRQPFHFVTRPKVLRERFDSRQRRLSPASRPSLLV